jgi:hypothetical protein
MRKLLWIPALLILISSSCKSPQGPVDPVQLNLPGDYRAPTNAPAIR